ncbi:P-loop containing nucleoside triphosphate hydrolase protein [Choiromyces venosus 120613-1]|uniref:P-loop containing nucleoside triphosphate hydrolase protein n=1 Tax=Choiromyces venosus 120613-1 TaxID=1336337 RepID=A0A3N4JYH2_9PEZI|nr:P-loop containing nucleoside triphosphate hydrolase protein [Choiromyces venosus 120613-1]
MHRFLFSSREQPAPTTTELSSSSSPAPSPPSAPYSARSDSPSQPADIPTHEYLLIEESKSDKHRHKKPETPVCSYTKHFSAPAISTDLVLRAAIEAQHPDQHLSISLDHNCDIFGYASSTGKIKLTPSTSKANPILSKLTFQPSTRRANGPGSIGHSIDFAKFMLCRDGKEFVYYFASWPEGYNIIRAHYFLHSDHEKADVEDIVLQACAYTMELHQEILVFNDGNWSKDHALWKSVQKADWKDVILDTAMKHRLQSDVKNFFNSEDIYKHLGVPWKRGIIFYGPPGNGKTISIKALMKSTPYPSLYVKSFKSYMGDEHGMAAAFDKARAFAPCILILEDLDSLINPMNRSFFLNELDGLVENDGILVIGTTNHLEMLDPGIVNRPSRFDRKYYFPMPNTEERKMYCRYWQHKLEGNDDIEFGDALVEKIAEWTPDFSFAYLKEAFVSTLLIIAAMGRDVVGRREGDGDGDGDQPGLFERIIKDQIDSLKKEMGNG